MSQSAFTRLLTGIAGTSAMVVATGCSGDASPESIDSNSSGLINAPLDTEHPFAIGICHGELSADGSCQRGAPRQRCSGTLVAPNLVLTARHCVHKPVWPTPETLVCDAYFVNEPAKVGGTRVTTAPSVQVGVPSWVDVEKIVVSPTDNSGCDGDVAALILSRNIDDVAPVHWVNLGTGAPSSVTIVGRGLIDYAIDPVTGAPTRYDDGQLMRRILRNIPFVCAGVGCSVEDLYSPPSNVHHLSPGQILLGVATLSGDSGAGTLYNDGPATLFAVHSMGPKDLRGESSGSIEVRLSQHASWIRATAVEAADKGNYEPARWALRY